MPVFAAEDGVVTYVHDDDPDETVLPQGQSNIVAVAHASGTIESQYFHLAQNSADAAGIGVGSPVVAGQEIGRVGSSGASYGPHLHFENRFRPGFALYDPFRGACNPGPSGWKSRPPLQNVLELTEFAVRGADFFDPATPFLPPAAAAPGAALLRRGRQRHVLDRRAEPAGERRDRGALLPARRPAPDRRAPRGRRKGPRAFNRPPEPIGVVLDPPAPGRDDVAFCRVQGSLVLDDLDWDVVRYRYLWKRGGVVVRDVVSARRGDAIPRGTAGAGDALECTVTPNDGQVDGAPASASVT